MGLYGYLERVHFAVAPAWRPSFSVLPEPHAHYDVRMTRAQATYLRPLVVPALEERIASRTYTEIFLNIGKTYHMALDGWDVSLTRDITVLYARGGIGQKASQMCTWLLAKIGDRA